MQNRPLNIGVDVGGTNIKFGLTDESGRIISLHRVRTAPETGPDGIIGSIAANLQVVVERAGATLSQVNSLGVGIPGTIDSRNGTVVFAPNIFWRHVEFVRKMRSLYDGHLYIAQDSRAAAWGEYVVGVGKGLSSIATITLGTGVGCGMVIDGKIFNGALNTAGEFGHQIVELEGNLCNCGRTGCLEAHAGGLAIVREAKAKIVDLSDVLHKSQDDISAKDIFDLAQQGHGEARKLTARVVRYIGIGLVNLINLNSPELISISGGIANAPPGLLLEALITFVRSRAYPAISAKVRICKSAFAEDASLIGASLLHRQPLPDRDQLSLCV
jgi:glucokinase